MNAAISNPVRRVFCSALVQAIRAARWQGEPLYLIKPGSFMNVTGDAVHLLLDTGHVTWGGGDPVRVAHHYRSRISHIHAKDVRDEVMWQAQKEDWSFLDAVIAGVYTVPGDGMIDYVSVFQELPGYSGWVVVEAEQDPEKAHPLTYAKMGINALKRFLHQGGLT